ncbi:MAG: hypothetical protein KDK30_15140 [Leptospiraceae bacterium]|nr:hypothetical protein [Leptospiraceae bacterium]
MRKFSRHILSTVLLIPAFVCGCNNNPYGSFADANGVLYTTLEENPDTLDPARAFDINSFLIGSNIYDTVYEYHYLKRPLQLKPSMATAPPDLFEQTIDGRRFYTLRVQLRTDLYFQDDACFPGGRGRNINIDDLIFAVKRAADRSLAPFARPFFMDRMPGFRAFGDRLARAYQEREQAVTSQSDPVRAAYRHDIKGIRRLNEYAAEFLFTETFPQIQYVFAMISTAPVPAECVFYYHGRDGRASFNRHPVASGPFYLKEWTDNHRLILERNPAYRKDDFYPQSGSAADEAAGLLKPAGQSLPLLRAVHIRIIKRGPPKWALFGQGYLDMYSNRLDLRDRLMQSGQLSEQYREQGVRRFQEIEFATFGWSVNMNDPVLGSNRPLRQAISLAVDRDEMIRLFLPDRAVIADGPIPPGIDGHAPRGSNPYVDYNPERARALLARAGYPDGIDARTGKRLQLTLYDRAAEGRAAIYKFYIQQLEQIGVQLRVEPFDFPTLVEKKRQKDFQLIHWGWGADYPDAQNFMQLFYGPNITTPYNEFSFQNDDFDALYERIYGMQAGPQREQLLTRMNSILAQEVPVIYLYHRESQVLAHRWLAPMRPSPMHFNEFKYWQVDAKERASATTEWNRVPTVTYVLLIITMLVTALVIFISLRQWRSRNGVRPA